MIHNTDGLIMQRNVRGTLTTHGRIGHSLIGLLHWVLHTRRSVTTLLYYEIWHLNNKRSLSSP